MKHMVGVSMLEMMLVLTVSGFLFLPILSDYYSAHQSRLARDRIIDLIAFAEQNALLTGQVMGLCFSDNLANCSHKYGNNLLIFSDKFMDGRILDQSQILLKKRVAPSGAMIRWQFFPYYRSYLKIRPNVMTMTDNGSIWVGVGRYGWRILVNKTGNVHFVVS